MALVVGVLWVVVGFALVALLLLEWLTLSDYGCAVPGVDRLGEASWQAWPPGEVCTFGDARFVEPPASRGLLIVIEGVIGVLLFVVWRRFRNAPEPDWTQ